MSRSRTRFVLATVAGAGLASAALAFSPAAMADPTSPVIPEIPAVPGLDVVQQVATDALVPAATQPDPLATASVTVPQTLAVPQTTTVPQTSLLPQTVLPQTVATPEAQLVPSADVSIPTVPGLPVPLPSEVSLPGDLLSLLPVAINSATAPLAAAASAPTLPTAGLP